MPFSLTATVGILLIWTVSQSVRACLGHTRLVIVFMGSAIGLWPIRLALRRYPCGIRAACDDLKLISHVDANRILSKYRVRNIIHTIDIPHCHR